MAAHRTAGPRDLRLFWVFCFYASLVTFPHHLEEGGLRLRYGAFAQGLVPYSEKIERKARNAPRPGDGLQTHPGESALYLAIGGMADLTLRLRTPQIINALSRTAEPAMTIHLAADEPEEMISKLRGHAGEPVPSKPPALA